MTPTLAAFHNLARELEVSEEIERGLVFLLALLLCVIPADPEMAAEYARRRARLTPYGDEPPEDRGGEFYGDLIAALMFECAEKLGYELQPRLIRLSSGASFPSYEAPSEERLPQLGGEILNLAGAERLAQRVFAQIGEAIDEDLEGAFIAGLRFVSGYGSVDVQTTATLIEALDTIMPPHMQWIVRSVAFTPEDVTASNPMQCVAERFIGPGEGNELFLIFLDRLYFSAPGEWRPEISGSSSADLYPQVVRRAHWFARAPELGSDVAFVRANLRRDLVPPPSGVRLDQAIRATYRDVAEQWCFALDEDDGEHYYGERLDRRLCGIYSIYRRMILNPNWIRGEDLGKPLAFD